MGKVAPYWKYKDNSHLERIGEESGPQTSGSQEHITTTYLLRSHKPQDGDNTALIKPPGN